jgi:hypothetical protein
MRRPDDILAQLRLMPQRRWRHTLKQLKLTREERRALVQRIDRGLYRKVGTQRLTPDEAQALTEEV